MAEPSVTDNVGRRRFELALDGQIAFADYWLDGDKLVIPHVETPQALRGHGVAGQLMEGVVDHARKAGLKIVPVCTYAQAWMRRHREHEDILA